MILVIQMSMAVLMLTPFLDRKSRKFFEPDRDKKMMVIKISKVRKKMVDVKVTIVFDLRPSRTTKADLVLGACPLSTRHWISNDHAVDVILGGAKHAKSRKFLGIADSKLDKSA